LLGYIASNLESRTGTYLIDILPAEEDEAENPLHNLTFDRVKLKIGYGQYTFKNFKGETLYALYQHVGETVGTNCGVDIMKNLVIFSSNSIESLCKFISEIIVIAETPQHGKFLCFNWHVKYQYWREEARMEARPIDSVVLPKIMKDKLIGDISKFLNPATKHFYVRNGIPYRRSYLFYGIPGTGKTSMVQALAGYFRRNICFLLPTHPEMTDDSLREAIRRIPSNSIVVFEDIDALFDGNRQMKLKNSSLTFSGLLNALDGIITTHGQIFILTTNLRENLDAALIRNGRVDLHFEFSYAMDEQIEQMWKNFYPQTMDAGLEKEFSRKVRESLEEQQLQVTTSALQHFFIQQMDATPEEAMAAIPTIVEEILINSSKAMLESAATKKGKKEKKTKGKKGKKKHHEEEEEEVVVVDGEEEEKGSSSDGKKSKAKGKAIKKSKKMVQRGKKRGSKKSKSSSDSEESSDEEEQEEEEEEEE
jgi:chaperone BCS1